MINVRDLPIGTELEYVTKFGNNKIIKIADSKDVTDIVELHDRPLAYFTWLDRHDAVSRDRFIAGMREEIGGSTIGAFVIWQHDIDHGFVSLLPITIPVKLYEQAVKLVKGGYSEAYIQSQMWAARDEKTSIKDISRSIRKAMVDLGVTKESLNFTVQN